MTLILRSLATQFGFQTWVCLSNPDVYCIASHGERVEISRSWVPPCLQPAGVGVIIRCEGARGYRGTNTEG
jgi:hypothetical protein